MATNFHPDLPNDQIHNPKDFSEANNSSVLTRSGTGLLDWNTSPYGTSTTVTCGADVSGGLHNTTFFVFLNAANKAECHFNVSGETAVFVPTPAFFQIVIDIAPNDSAITVAAAIKTEFDGQAANPFGALTTTVNGTGKVTFSGMTNSPDTIDGNTNFTFDNVKTYTGTTVLTSTSGELAWLPSSGGGGSTPPQSFSVSFESVLTNGNYFFGNLRYGWNYVIYNASDNNMQLAYYELTSAMVAINDYTEISVKGIAGSMRTSNAISIEFSVWKGTNTGGTGTLSTTEMASTNISFSQSDELKPLSFGATGLTITEGDYIFLAVRNPSYSVREDIFCSTTITFS